MTAFVGAGLRDLERQPDLVQVGHPVPDDPAHVMAVCSMPCEPSRRWDSRTTSRFNHYWPADVHLMGKEIVRQHSVLAGVPDGRRAARPRRVIGRMVADERGKMSNRSATWCRPQGYVERFGVDALRYFVITEMVVGRMRLRRRDVPDVVTPTWQTTLGNVVSRVTTMIQRMLEATFRRVRPRRMAWTTIWSGTWNAPSAAATREAERFDFSSALRVVWDLSPPNSLSYPRALGAREDPASRPGSRQRCITRRTPFAWLRR
jgi:methionyl-tRNA synthetase